MSIKKILPYLVSVVVFALVSLIYFHPVLEGKKIEQSDIRQFIGMSKEIVDYRAEFDEEPYWTNAAFGGMPSYQVSTYYPNDFIKKIDSVIRFLPRPADYLFLYFVGFFILLLTLRCDWKLALIGALAFGFSTYFIIILGVGHNAKAHAIGYIPIVLAGILMVFQKRYLWGFMLTALAMALEINASHPQMTYYLLFAVLILGVFKLIEAVKEQQLHILGKQLAILIVAVILAIGTNASSLLATKEYVAHSTRGKSDLTINENGSPKQQTSGLSKEYITAYSYGKLETFNLFIPRFMGGASVENVGTDSQIYRFLRGKVDPRQALYWSKSAPTYWGTQPGVSAPAYIGAVFIFLFILGLFLVKGTLKKWLLASVIFFIALSWGKNSAFLTDFFIDYMPLYSKFRAVSSMQVMVEIAIPLLGILGLKELFSEKIPKEIKQKYLKYALFITGGLAGVFMIFGTYIFDFIGAGDGQYDAMLPGLADAIQTDRKSMFFTDSLRTLLLIIASAGVLWLFLKEKIKRDITLLIIGGLLLFDMATVAHNYVNASHFVAARKVDKPFVASAIDKEILKDKSYYRVANLAGNPMNDGATSYFHKSIGGYHAAKPGRYQELYYHHIAANNMEVLNMLNVKYFMFKGADERLDVQQNYEANGNAWFVSNIVLVDTANEEISSLKSDVFNSKTAVVINKKQLNPREVTIPRDSTAVIKLTVYKANELHYQTFARTPQLAVFSEMYYQPGWNAYLDGEKTKHFRANYVLRAMEIPAGEHRLVFKFEPTVIATGGLISLISFLLMLGIAGVWFFIDYRKKMQ